MKKIYAIAIACCFTFFNAARAQERKHCGTTEVYNQTMLDHPELKKSEQQLEDFTQNFIRSHANQRQSSTILIVPIVFHIIHNYGAENISDDQVIDAVRILNRDYSLQNADTSNLIPAFQGLAANIGVEFRLATIDPIGNCTNGIDRVASYRTHNGDDYSKLDDWDHTKYLNVWTIADFGPTHNGAAAYAYLPGGVPSAAVDGVIALSSYVGSIGSSSVTNARTLTHEIGHCFNLQHPWGNTNQPGVACGDDGVSDTPITKGWDHCPSNNYDVCNAGIDENFQNYMDYSYCDVMFTNGQKSRMIAALNDPLVIHQNRFNLWQGANLVATGTSGTATPSCAPIADFLPVSNHICSGDSVQYLSGSHNADSLTYLWSFPSGSPSTSTLESPYVTYTTPGTYSATLTVTSPGGNSDTTKTNIITVFGAATLPAIYTDDFETAGTFPGGGYVENPDNSSIYKWNRVTGIVGSSGSAAIKMRNSGTNHVGELDSWITDAFDLSNYAQCFLKYKLAYSNYNVAKVETLKVYYSINCGKSWILRLTKSGSALATTTAFSNFVPSATSQWRQETVNPGAASGKPNVRFKFEFESGGTTSSPYGDNNLYIDDIQLIGNYVGIDEANREDLSFSIAPNPTSGDAFVSFNTRQNSDVEMYITDLLGRHVMTVVNSGLQAGQHGYTINTSQFAKGVYLVQLKAGDVLDSQKLIVQ